MPSRRTYSADDWDTASEYSSILSFAKPIVGEGTTFRLVNNLDSDIDISVSMTDVYDVDGERRESLMFWSDGLLGPLYERPQGSMSEDGEMVTISAGTTRTCRLTTMWSKIEFSITPATTPTSGQFEVIQLDDST